MAVLIIQLDQTPPAYKPGQTITGQIMWKLDADDENLELRLFWHTAGIGDADTQTIDTIQLETVAREGEKTFSFTAPNGPFSFSGKLISILWSLELVALPAEEAASQDLVISPTGQQVTIENSASNHNQDNAK